MAFLTDKNQFFFKDESIQCSTEDKHVFCSLFVFPKPTIKQKEEAMASEKAVCYYDKIIGNYQIICSLYHVERERFKIRKHTKPLNDTPFTGIHLITGSFKSPSQTNIFHFKSFSCDFYVGNEFPDFSPNEILYIVTHLFERKEQHNINYLESLKKYISENSLCNNKKLTIERLKRPFNEKNILEYGLVHLEHRSTKYHTEKEAYSDALITQIKEPITLKNENVIHTAVLIYCSHNNLYGADFLHTHIFDESIKVSWKKSKATNKDDFKSLRKHQLNELPDLIHKDMIGDFYISSLNFRGVDFFNGKDYLNERENDPEFSKFLTVFTHNFTFFTCIEDHCGFSFKNNNIEGDVHKLHFGDLFTLMGIKSEYNINKNQFISKEQTNLKDDITNSLLLKDSDIINAIINDYKQKKEAKEGFFFELKELNDIIEDPLYFEQKTPDDFELLKINYQDIDLLSQYINSVPKLLLNALHRAFNENDDKHILQKAAFHLK
jgi:ribosomal protein S18